MDCVFNTTSFKSVGGMRLEYWVLILKDRKIEGARDTSWLYLKLEKEILILESQDHNNSGLHS